MNDCDLYDLDADDSCNEVSATPNFDEHINSGNMFVLPNLFLCSLLKICVKASPLDQAHI